jgi:hypothetical protein
MEYETSRAGLPLVVRDESGKKHDPDVYFPYLDQITLGPDCDGPVAPFDLERVR